MGRGGSLEVAELMAGNAQTVGIKQTHKTKPKTMLSFQSDSNA